MTPSKGQSEGPISHVPLSGLRAGACISVPSDLKLARVASLVLRLADGPAGPPPGLRTGLCFPAHTHAQDPPAELALWSGWASGGLPEAARRVRPDQRGHGSAPVTLTLMLTLGEMELLLFEL